MTTTFYMRDYYDWEDRIFAFPNGSTISEKDLRDLHYCGRAKILKALEIIML